MSVFMSINRLESLLHETSKIPDHAIVTLTVSVISHRHVFLNEPTADHPSDTNYAGQDGTRLHRFRVVDSHSLIVMISIKKMCKCIHSEM